jgi:hypothetical protein
MSGAPWYWVGQCAPISIWVMLPFSAFPSGQNLLPPWDSEAKYDQQGCWLYSVCWVECFTAPERAPSQWIQKSSPKHGMNNSDIDGLEKVIGDMAKWYDVPLFRFDSLLPRVSFRFVRFPLRFPSIGQSNDRRRASGCIPSPVRARGWLPRHFWLPPDAPSPISRPRPIPYSSEIPARLHLGQHTLLSVHPIATALTSRWRSIPIQWFSLGKFA